jgi:hypothetical protein
MDENVITTSGTSSISAAWGDYNNDGLLDLFVASHENDLLFRNEGNGVFAQIADEVIVNDGADSRGCAWGDYDNDGFLDLFVTTIRDWQSSLPQQWRWPHQDQDTIVARDIADSFACSWATTTTTVFWICSSPMAVISRSKISSIQQRKCESAGSRISARRHYVESLRHRREGAGQGVHLRRGPRQMRGNRGMAMEIHSRCWPTLVSAMPR